MLRRISLALAAAALLPAAASAQTYYEHVRPVLVDNCMTCHTTDGPAWSMEDAEATYDRAQRIARAIEARRMPPFLAADGHQEYMGDISLDSETISVIQEWAAAGYPKGEARRDKMPAVPAGAMHHTAFTGDVALEVLNSEGYLPNQESNDDYRCFLVDWTEDTDQFLTGFRARPGNTNVAHHVVVYGIEPEMWQRYRDLEDIEEGPGYTCFGGALPDRLLTRDARTEYEATYPNGVRELDRASWWLAHWAPGMDGHIFPEGTGIPIKPGGGMVVQMHYYSSTAPGEKDANTALDFMTEFEVDRPAMNLSQTRSDWLGGAQNQTMVIPDGEMRTYEYADDLGQMAGYIARLTGVDPETVTALEVHSANLHMHAIGHSGRITLRDPTGRLETLLEVPRWDLNWQRDFTFMQPKVIPARRLNGVRLAVECTFENTTGATVYGGFGSGDEMCFNFSYIAVVTEDESGGGN